MKGVYTFSPHTWNYSQSVHFTESASFYSLRTNVGCVVCVCHIQLWCLLPQLHSASNTLSKLGFLPLKFAKTASSRTKSTNSGLQNVPSAPRGEVTVCIMFFLQATFQLCLKLKNSLLFLCRAVKQSEMISLPNCSE